MKIHLAMVLQCKPVYVLDPCDNVKCSFDGVCQLADGIVSCRCLDACDDAKREVCGSDGRTYINECYMRQRSCKLRKEIEAIKNGPCGEM